MSSLFGHTNPLASQVGQRIDQATDGNLLSEDWALNMEICDIISETDDGPKDAIKAIRKKIQINVGKNYKVIMYTLTILETCVKNCGKRFHIYVANKDFLHELIKIIGPKNDPPQNVQEKVLSLIQTWADAFRNNPELKEVEKVYVDLKSKGIEFPMTDLDSMVPIHTPAWQTAPSQPQLPQSYQYYPPQIPAPQVPVPSSGTVNPTVHQMSKMRSELSVVNGNIRVFSEMLSDLSPTHTDPADLELLQELNRTCRNIQQRIVDLVDTVANEEVTVELLTINDALNNVFLRYDRFERYRTGQSGVSPAVTPLEEPSVIDPPPPSYDQVYEQTNPNVGNLIDFGEELKNATSTDVNNIDSRLAGIDIKKENAAPQSDDFDMFAHSRQSFDQNRKAIGDDKVYDNQRVDEYEGSLGQAINSKSAPMTDKEILDLQDAETDYDEMERWLAVNDPNNSSSGTQQLPGVTSSEFDQFLSERSVAANNLPEISTRNTSQSRRQIEKEDDTNALFAL